MTARAALRVVLGAYLRIGPRDVRFAYGRRGKPRLSSPAELRFNASASSGLAVFALTLDCEVGIDVEAIRPVAEMDAVARRFFSSEEVAALERLPQVERDRPFYACWTRKEAYVKAVGDGLAVPLDSFRVTLLADETPRVIEVAGDAATASAWSLHDLDLGASYAGALAYRDAPRPLRMRALVDAGDLLVA